jgi:hypothetical protein
MRIKHWVGSAMQWFAGFFKGRIIAPIPGLKRSRRKRPPITVAPRYRGIGNPPPLHWKECDRSTVMRFKAVLTCPHGHSMTLRAHMIESNGTVRPSVICRSAGCGFHDFVRLRDWDLGRLVAHEN